MSEELLTTSDKQSPLWLKVTRIVRHRLEVAQTRLEGTIDEAETNRVRGKIAELRAILSFGDDDPAVD
jgi:hypothetical protein